MHLANVADPAGSTTARPPSCVSEPWRGTRFSLRIGFLCLLLGLCSAQPALGLAGTLNINTATLAELQMLPYVGEERARAILRYRNVHGPFFRLDDIVHSGEIGENTFEAIRPYLTLSGPSTLVAEVGRIPGVTIECTDRFLATRPGEVRLLPDGAYYDTLIHFIRNARERIDIGMFLFKSTKTHRNRPAELAEELVRAHARGVKVRVILERSGHDDDLNAQNSRVGRQLQDKGVSVVFDSPKVTSHEKVAVIDGRYSFVGSHNFTHSALYWNHELSLLVDSMDVARQVEQYLESLIFP